MTRPGYLTDLEQIEVDRLQEHAALCDRASALYRRRPGNRDRAEKLFARARLAEARAARIKAEAYKARVSSQWRPFDPESSQET